MSGLLMKICNPRHTGWRRFRTFASSAGAASLVALAATATANAADARRDPVAAASASYGLVASNAVFVTGDTLAERTASYRRLHRAGVQAIRLDINWAQVEPPGEPLGAYDFSERDREVRAIRRAGMKVIGLLAYGHSDYSQLGAFLSGTPLGGGVPPFYVLYAQYFPPDDPADFARYSARTARHYAREFPGTVIAWEVWNEENQGWRFWPPHEDPAAYAELLCATYPALKRVDHKLPVAFGGLFFPAVANLPGLSATAFVHAAYETHPDVGGCYDVMAYHPYPYPFTAPELDVPIRGSVLSAYDQMREALEREGDGQKPLWITEVGWPTHDRTYGVSERKQAQYVARMQAASFAQDLPVLTWYTYGDYADPTGANQEAWFGFFRPDGSAKPSYRALRTFAHVFHGAKFSRDRSRELGLPEGRESFGGRGFALEFVRRHGPNPARITALWLANESALEGQGGLPDGGTATPKTVQVSVPVGRRGATVVDYLGESHRVVGGGVKREAGRGPPLSVETGPGPKYVVQPLSR